MSRKSGKDDLATRWRAVPRRARDVVLEEIHADSRFWKSAARCPNGIDFYDGESREMAEAWSLVVRMLRDASTNKAA